MNDHDIRHFYSELKDIKLAIQDIQKSANWLDMKGASKYSSCSRSTILSGIQCGKLKHVKTTGKIRMKTSWVDKWLTYGDCKRKVGI